MCGMIENMLADFGEEVKYGLMENNDNIVTSFLFSMDRLTSRVRL